MNTQKMLELADFMETVPEEHFNMDYFGDRNLDVTCQEDLNVCGTTCCIAGYVVVNKGLCVTPGGNVYKDKDRSEYVGKAEDVAGEELGLDNPSTLFYAWNWPYEFVTKELDYNDNWVYSATPKQAAARIRHMVETGE